MLSYKQAGFHLRPGEPVIAGGSGLKGPLGVIAFSHTVQHLDRVIGVLLIGNKGCTGSAQGEGLGRIFSEKR